jgi:hypothetical protein
MQLCLLWKVGMLAPVLFEDDERRIFLCMLLPLHQDEEHFRILLSVFEPLQAASSADDEHREREGSRWPATHCIGYV